MAGIGAFSGTRVLEIVKKFNSTGLLWKRIKPTPTRKRNSKKRLLRIWQNEAVLRACSKDPIKENDSNPGPLETEKTSEVQQQT